MTTPRVGHKRKQGQEPHSQTSKQPTKRFRVNKGLRHFSIKVCEKLSQTGTNQAAFSTLTFLSAKAAYPELLHIIISLSTQA